MFTKRHLQKRSLPGTYGFFNTAPKNTDADQYSPFPVFMQLHSNTKKVERVRESLCKTESTNFKTFEVVGTKNFDDLNESQIKKEQHKTKQPLDKEKNK